jgi:glycolate oxidase FAD binding subunit
MCTRDAFPLPISRASEDLTPTLAERVTVAAQAGTALRIVGGGSKDFYGRRVEGEVLALAGHRGIISYAPSELVITARVGTPLSEIVAELAAHGQMLPFEPPTLGDRATLGGTVATGFAGPRRPFTGSVRDSVLGVTVLDGCGRRLRFGGQVFKNVAGFDAFRLMAGALGRLGVLLDVSLRIMPVPPAERLLAFEGPWSRLRERLEDWMVRPLPLSGACHDGERLHLRLSGGETAVAEAAAELGGEDGPAGFWEDLRELRGPVLAAPRLWRISLPRTRRLARLEGEEMWDWAGGQLWLAGEAAADPVHAAVRAAGGHATLFRGAKDGETVFQPLSAPLMALHRRLAAALDPAGVLNPGRMYAEL